jgi:hypothetical protein
LLAEQQKAFASLGEQISKLGDRLGNVERTLSVEPKLPSPKQFFESSGVIGEIDIEEELEAARSPLPKSRRMGSI